MPPYDETSRVGRPSGQVRRPPAGRSTPSGSGGGGGRPVPPNRARTSASRSTGQPGRPTPPRSGGGSGRPPGGRPPVRPTGGGGNGRGPGGSGPKGGKRKLTKKQKRRRVLAWLGGLFAAFVVLMGVFIGIVYASTDVPSPESLVQPQASTIYYSDGTTVMAKLAKSGGNRQSVKLDQVSEPARNAVLAAENRSFYTDPGISFTGILRAAWSNVTGGSTQGGSTITQQYVKNAVLKNSEQTYSRKFKEIFLAVKLDNQYSKDEILQNYLNTIYFGRGAYGIEQAAQTYFGVPASQLTAEQGAVLAVLVRNPTYYDPANSPEVAQDRWGKVLDGMVQEKWMDAAARKAAVYPQVQPKADNSSLGGIPSGPEGLIVSQVVAELKKAPFNVDDIYTAGVNVVTTVDAGKQKAAEDAVADVMDGEDDKLRQALVAVDPKTGGVLAYYGGAKGTGDGAIDYAQAYRAPGSSFKPYTLATALENGISVDARRNGSSPQKFEDRDKPVSNASNAQCADCTLRDAITKSLNTTFYGLALEVGPTNVRETARAAMGVGDTWPASPFVRKDLQGTPTLANADGDTGGAIGIGEYVVTPVDQAVGFATFANGGTMRPAHFVTSISNAEGTINKKSDDSTIGAKEGVVPADVASDVTYAMEEVAGASKRALDGKRPVASKTGTQGLNNVDNSDAWMVGYTPSIVTSVWMGKDTLQPIKNAQGKIIYGSGLPGQIWQKFMNTVLKGTPVEKLPAKPIITGDKGTPINPVPVTSAPATASNAPQADQPPAQQSTAQATPTPTGNGTGTNRRGGLTDQQRQQLQEQRRQQQQQEQQQQQQQQQPTQQPTQQPGQQQPGQQPGVPDTNQ
ncbi:transglycosylase domain-containing protein [Modestobacter sp. NPDC049651]|uniref:transglycosylase domain-containing protein n=1 Tax=unclassified Modestobacter TaxID=2643866 RepID=UPI0033CEDDAA